MTDVTAPVLRCETCGAELPADGAPCPACLPKPEEAPAPVVPAEATEAEACEAADPECAPGSLWVRFAVAGVYLVVGAAAAYGSVAFFDSDFTTSSDWIFGAMAIALALIALLGIKESLFPSNWTPE
jgi:hypothetical protein